MSNSSTDAPGTSAHALLWRSMRRTYVELLGLYALWGAVIGFTLGLDFTLVFLCFFGLAVLGTGLAGCVFHIVRGIRFGVPRFSVVFEAIAILPLSLGIGGSLTSSVASLVNDVQVERTKALADAMIDEVRAFRATHGRWPEDAFEAGIEPDRLERAPLRLEWWGGSEGTAPRIAFARHPTALVIGELYRDADSDTWTDWID